MDFGIALEIVRNGLRRNILNCHARLGKRFNIRLEIAQVAAEHRYAVAFEQAHHIRQQLHVFALDAPSVFANGLRILKRRRVHENQIEAAPPTRLTFNPLQHIGAHEAMLGAIAAVQFHIAMRPRQIGLR